MSSSDTVRDEGGSGWGRGMGKSYRISGRLLSVIFLIVVLIAIGMAVWNISYKLKTTQKGLERLIRDQAKEITYLQGEVFDERRARQEEFASAAQARKTNKEFQENTLKQITGLTDSLKDMAKGQSAQTQDVTKKILGEIESTRRASQATKNEAIETQQHIKRQNRILQKQSRPFIKLFWIDKKKD
jgi:hypothetical protein